MSRSRKLQLHIVQIEEMRTILNSMKNLALIETHKLDRLLIMQGRVVANIEKAARDFLNFYPCLPEPDDSVNRVCILMGSERGFCGDFNESLIESTATGSFSGMIAIGSRLCNRLENNLTNVIATLEGANTAEEVPGLLDRLINTIGLLQETHGFIALTVVYHDYQTSLLAQRQVLPPFSLQQEKMCYKTVVPPALNLEPTDFFTELIDQYLFAVLHEIFYHSLMAENQRRQQHLEGAVQHLDDEIIGLHRKSQIYRQEEITEEIEVILLNSENR